MTMISHITSWCRSSISAAILDAGVWKYHGAACAAPESASPLKPASAATTFVPLMSSFPESEPQSLLQLGGELGARLLVEVPPQLQLFAGAAQLHARAVWLYCL